VKPRQFFFHSSKLSSPSLFNDQAFLAPFQESVHQLFETIKEELTEKAVSIFMDFGQAARFLLRNSSTSEVQHQNNFLPQYVIIYSH
jgi:hypothetical protein